MSNVETGQSRSDTQSTLSELTFAEAFESDMAENLLASIRLAAMRWHFYKNRPDDQQEIAACAMYEMMMDDKRHPRSELIPIARGYVNIMCKKDWTTRKKLDARLRKLGRKIPKSYGNSPPKKNHARRLREIMKRIESESRKRITRTRQIRRRLCNDFAQGRRDKEP
ncbi:MAG: hypothetical protein O7G85_04250, partial [Planctomycetota bacterium]|nr:hypothetical protein [Planctomycetota bacterium]